jgi:hypothetical protein
MTDDAIYVELVKRDGTVVGRTLIDAADAEYVNSYRWRVNADGYAVRDARVGEGVGKRVISLAKALMDVAPRDSRQVDHINRDRLDNRRSNLRVCTHAQNHQNVPGHPRSTSRFRGVSWDSARQRWERELQGTVAQVWNEARAGVGPEVEDSRLEAYERGVADGMKEGFEAAAAVGLAAVARIRDAVGLNAQIRSEEKTAAIRAACDMAERQWNAVLQGDGS